MVLKILSIFLALQVFLSSLSIHIGMHFCGNTLQSFALFQKAIPCEHAANTSGEKKACPFHLQKKSENKDCCGDKEMVVQGQDYESVLSFFSVEFIAPFDFARIFEANLSPAFSSENQNIANFRHYRPPPLFLDIPLLIQSFLI